MSSYIEQQLLRVAPLPLASDNNGQIRLKLHSARGETTWLNITAEQVKKIEQVLLADGSAAK